MKPIYRLGYYDPSNAAAGVEIIQDADLPKSPRRLRWIARHFNRLAAKEPDVFLLVGLFRVRPKVGANILRRKADVVHQRRFQILMPHHPLERHRTNFKRPPRAE
jgi:hypothetical protein